MKLRYATWNAVSTKKQAGADKVSIPVQIEKAREAARAHGWQHITDYTVPGQSRTNYISLNIAEKHIPQLHNMLEAAYRGEFDILIVYDLNRFRSLMLQVFDALCDCNVQLYVLSQPRDPVPPREYTQERKNELRLNVSLGDILSNNETSQIQRHYRDKMPKRITEKGLHAGIGRPPYGYRKPIGKELDRNAVLVQDPVQVAVIKQILRLFWDGCSLTEIASRLTRQNIPAPRGGKQWWYPQIRYILENPFYAGITGFGYTHWTRDRRAGTKTRHRGVPVTNKGNHQPVWDLDTHNRILAELQRRGQAHPGIKTRQLSRLLRCWCGAVLWAQIDAHRIGVWRCSNVQKGQAHIYIRDDHALEQVTQKIVHAITHLDQLTLPAIEDQRPSLLAEQKQLLARKQRWMDAYETEAINKTELHERLAPINKRLSQIEEDLRTIAQGVAQSRSTRARLQELAELVETLPHYYRHGDPKAVNADLHRLLKAIHVSKEKTITLDWR